jgi:hypothetical protein
MSDMVKYRAVRFEKDRPCISPCLTYTLLQNYRHTRNLMETRIIIIILAHPSDFHGNEAKWPTQKN